MCGCLGVISHIYFWQKYKALLRATEGHRGWTWIPFLIHYIKLTSACPVSQVHCSSYYATRSTLVEIRQNYNEVSLTLRRNLVFSFLVLMGISRLFKDRQCKLALVILFHAHSCPPDGNTVFKSEETYSLLFHFSFAFAARI